MIAIKNVITNYYTLKKPLDDKYIYFNYRERSNKVSDYYFIIFLDNTLFNYYYRLNTAIAITDWNGKINGNNLYEIGLADIIKVANENIQKEIIYNIHLLESNDFDYILSNCEQNISIIK